jgi:hypothetical protein
VKDSTKLEFENNHDLEGVIEREKKVKLRKGITPRRFELVEMVERIKPDVGKEEEIKEEKKVEMEKRNRKKGVDS